MKILMRNHKSDKWQLVQSAAYANESELQKLLFEQPSLISVEEAREGAGALVAAVREFPMDIGFIDIVGFTAAGDIAVVECKLANNAEVKRKVIGQVLEYGASLWEMSYEELDQKVLQRSSKSLVNLVRDQVVDPEWGEETFRTNIEHALQTGNFILIIVVDEINEELSRIVRFINDAGKPAFSIAALEMRRFQQEQTEILVPHLFGTVSKTKRETDSSRSRWTEQRLFEVARNSLTPELVAILQNLYTWSKSRSKRVWFGNGIDVGSFTFHYQDTNGRNISMFSVYTTGILRINYGWLSTQVDEVKVKNYHQAITAIPGFSHIPADFSKWPSVMIKDVFLNKPNIVAQFKEVIEKFGEQL